MKRMIVLGYQDISRNDMLNKNCYLVYEECSNKENTLLMLEFILGFISAGIYGGNNSLETQKIDRNIEMLKNYTWFKNIYDDENYHRMFFVNRKVRWYLQSSIRVKRIMKKEKARKRLIIFLNKQLQN